MNWKRALLFGLLISILVAIKDGIFSLFNYVVLYPTTKDIIIRAIFIIIFSLILTFYYFKNKKTKGIKDGFLLGIVSFVELFILDLIIIYIFNIILITFWEFMLVFLIPIIFGLIKK